MVTDSGPLSQEEIDFIKDFISKLGFGNTVDTPEGIIYKNWTKPIKELKALTIREITIFRLLSNGLTTTEVGKQLDLSRTSVKRDSLNAFNKLGVFNRTHAVAELFRLKVID